METMQQEQADKVEVTEKAQKAEARNSKKTSPTGIGPLDRLLSHSAVATDAAIVCALKIAKRNPQMGDRILEWLDEGEGIRELRRGDSLFDDHYDCDEYEALIWLSVDAGLNVAAGSA